MESIKKQQKIKTFGWSRRGQRVEKEVNQFLEQNPSINVKSMAINYTDNILLLYEE